MLVRLRASAELIEYYLVHVVVLRSGASLVLIQLCPPILIFLSHLRPNWRVDEVLKEFDNWLVSCGGIVHSRIASSGYCACKDIGKTTCQIECAIAASREADKMDLVQVDKVFGI